MRRWLSLLYHKISMQAYGEMKQTFAEKQRNHTCGHDDGSVNIFFLMNVGPSNHKSRETLNKRMRQCRKLPCPRPGCNSHRPLGPPPGGGNSRDQARDLLTYRLWLVKLQATEIYSFWWTLLAVGLKQVPRKLHWNSKLMRSYSFT